MEEQNYNVVPNIISSKDLDYLSDMFAWNYGAIKMANASINSVSVKKLKVLCKKHIMFFQDQRHQI